MKLVVISPENHHAAEKAIYKRIISEPKISHLHLRRKNALSPQEWAFFQPFAKKTVFSRACGTPPYSCKGEHGQHSKTSSSSHSVLEAYSCRAQFCYISPIYPSISKQGYSNEDLLPAIKELKNIPKNWVALGGIQPDNIEELKILGFKNIAVLGFIWNAPNPSDALDSILNAL